MHQQKAVIGRRFSILGLLKAGKRLHNVSFSLLKIHKHFSMFLIRDHTHITYAVYKPFYKEACLFRPLVYAVNGL